MVDSETKTARRGNRRWVGGWVEGYIRCWNNLDLPFILAAPAPTHLTVVAGLHTSSTVLCAHFDPVATESRNNYVASKNSDGESGRYRREHKRGNWRIWVPWVVCTTSISGSRYHGYPKTLTLFGSRYPGYPTSTRVFWRSISCSQYTQYLYLVSRFPPRIHWW